jgi:hypothetical protein
MLQIIESWFLLLYFDYLMHFHDFRAIQSRLLAWQARTEVRNPLSVETLSHAMDLASVFYIKRVLCLQRSAATAVLLRRHGWTAEMVIGAQVLPLQSHAWVEVERCVVNDKPYVIEIYRVLDRC